MKTSVEERLRCLILRSGRVFIPYGNASQEWTSLVSSLSKVEEDIPSLCERRHSAITVGCADLLRSFAYHRRVEAGGARTDNPPF